MFMIIFVLWGVWDAEQRFLNYVYVNCVLQLDISDLVYGLSHGLGIVVDLNLFISYVLDDFLFSSKDRMIVNWNL